MSPKPSFIHSRIAFGRPLWMRQRLNYVLMTLWTVGAIVGNHLMTRNLHGPTMAFFDIFGDMGAGMMLFGCLLFAFKICEIAAPRSFLPKRGEGLGLLTLPLPTTHLVLAPVVVVIASVLSFWVAYWVLAVWLVGGSAPFFVPAIALALIVTAPSTGSWGISAKNTIATLFLLVPVFGPLIAGIVMVNHLSLSILAVPFSLLFCGAIWASLASAPVARHSISRSSTRPTVRSKPSPKPRRTRPTALPVTSPLASQIWFHQMFKIPMISASLGAFIFPILVAFTQLFNDIHIPTVGTHRSPNFAGIVTWLMVPMFAFSCVSISALLIVGFNLPKPEPADLQPMPALIATRPISSLHILQAQMVTAFRCAIATCLAIGVEAAVWMHFNGVSTPIHSTFADLTLPLLLLISISLPILFVSLQSIAMLGARLPKHFTAILTKGFPYLFGAAAFASLQITSSFDFNNFVFPLGLSLLIIKLVLIGLVESKLETKRLISRTKFLQGIACWAAIVLIFGTAFSVLLPKGLIPAAEVFLIVALIIPANRILWQLYYLDASRHIGVQRS